MVATGNAAMSWLDLMTLRPQGECQFVGRGADDDQQRVFGGHVMAQSLVAAYHTVASDRLAHSLAGYFLRPGHAGVPIRYTVENTRDGGSFSYRRVVADQGGREIFSMQASFHLNEPGLNHADAAPTDVPPPEDCPPLVSVLAGRSVRTPESWMKEFGVVDVRFASDTSVLVGEPVRDAEMKVWLRSAEALPGDPRLHQAFLAYASDLTLLSVSTVPHPVIFAGPGMQVASINHSMWFHRPARADEWLLYAEVSPSASAGLGFGFGRLFSGGRLVASCAQEGLIRITDPSAVAAAQKSVH